MSVQEGGTAKALFAKPGFYFQQDYFIQIRCELVRAMLNSVSGASVLDLGCGDGRVSLQFCEEASEITLVDFSEAMLDRARQRIPTACASKVNVIQSDIMAFNPGRHFDVVICVGVLSHLPSVRDAIFQISSLLKPGGIAIVQLTDSGTLLGRLSLAVAYFRARLKNARSHWLQMTTVRQIAKWAGDSGLVLDGVKRHGVLPPGAGKLPNSTLLRWERFVIAHSTLSRTGADALVRFHKEKT
jgi:ubiquinone/menaquinone biosynthesis C-methylase UbiE